MNMKLIGGSLLIVGTSIGGGMLALPIATGTNGFISSMGLLVVGWLITTCCAFLLLEVNLTLPRGSNLISMARATLGKPGEVTAWVIYLLLLYCLLAAYISSGSEIVQQGLSALAFPASTNLAAVLFSLIMSLIIYHGISSVDYVNRFLMLSKFAIFALLIACILPLTSMHHLAQGQLHLASTSINVIITSFGFAIIIPSLRSYYNDDIILLKRVILIGTSIPLGCYLLWEAAIIGALPLAGSHSLLELKQSSQPIADLTQALNYQLGHGYITSLTDLFTSICVATSFLGVGLCLTDFLRDGLALKKSRQSHLLICCLAFLPPLLLVLCYPSLFITGLSYAGVLCTLLLILLPVLMAWSNRYWKKTPTSYQALGSKWVLYLLLLAAILLLLTNFLA